MLFRSAVLASAPAAILPGRLAWAPWLSALLFGLMLLLLLLLASWALRTCAPVDPSLNIATFETPAFRMGVVLGNLGLLLPARGGVAVSVSGDPVFALKDGYSLDNNMAFQGVGFEYNSTGAAVDEQLVGDFAKTLQLPIGTQEHPFVSAIVTGLNLKLGDFATLSGDFAFQYRNNQDLAIVADKVAAKIGRAHV